MSLTNLIKRHPLPAYFALVYLLAWGGVLLVVQASTSAEATTRVAITALPLLLAPGLAGITVTALVEGRAGLGALLRRMTHWQVGAGWYAAALAVMPLLVLATLAALAVLTSADYAPTFSLLGLAVLAAGFMEEIGWTGFATPRLLARWRPA
jgi:hypothetical protein